MNGTTPQELAESLLEVGEASEAATEATTELSNALRPIGRQLPTSRLARRAAARAERNANIRQAKTRVRNLVANERGTLPGAREIAKIERTRRAMIERSKLATTIDINPVAYDAAFQEARAELDAQYGPGVIPDEAIHLGFAQESGDAA